MVTLKEGFVITDEQYAGMIRLVERYGKEPVERYIELGYGALMCQWDGLTVGIEKDGHAHS